jgi:hypothetical protein
MVELQPSKLIMRVRFPPPAPAKVLNEAGGFRDPADEPSTRSVGKRAITTCDHRTGTLTLERRHSFVLFAVGTAAAVAAVVLLMDRAGYTALGRVIGRLDPIWLVICFASQLLAYLGYVLAVRDIARVDNGPGLSFSLTTRTVIAGFGVYAATHASGGFTVDCWALRRSGLRAYPGRKGPVF